MDWQNDVQNAAINSSEDDRTQIETNAGSSY